MESLIEKIEYKGHTINVGYDPEPENPRTSWDNFGHMVCFHKRYDLGDNTGKQLDGEVKLTSDMFNSWSELENHLIKKLKAKLISPLYLYDHSGLSIKIGSFNGMLPQGHAEFDSGQVGYIYCTSKDIIKEFGRGKKAIEMAENCLKAEVETYNDYLSGSVYGFEIEKDGLQIESCWGYFGDTKEMIAECKLSIDNIIKREEQAVLVKEA